MSDVTKVLEISSGDALNMGWTSVGLWRISLTFFGLFVILFTLVLLLSFDNYRDDTDDKTVPLIIGSIGFAFFLFGLILTDRRFSQISSKMRLNTAVFATEGFDASAKALQANIKALNELKDQFTIVEAITKADPGFFSKLFGND